MAMSNAERVKRAQAKCDAITIRPRKDKGRLIRAAAEAAGQPLQRYIMQAVDERMERDKAVGQIDDGPGTALHGPPDDPGAGR